MKHTDFSACTIGQQRRVLLEQAVYLAHRKDAPWSVLLYQLETFYVEVYFSVDDLNIDRIEAFSDTERLDPYLERISLEDLLTV